MTRVPVFLYVPNCVGYVRAALVLAAAGFQGASPVAAWWLMAVAFVLDGVDGYLARRLNQVAGWLGT